MTASSTEIELRTENGKWTYKTTLNDPLFSGILGALAEEGMEVPNPFIFHGSVAEALEEEWTEVKLLLDWVEWRNKYRKVGIIPALNSKNPQPSTRFPSLHRLSRLANILTLPAEWQIMTMVDNKNTPLQERVDHVWVVSEIMRNTAREKSESLYMYEGWDHEAKVFLYSDTTRELSFSNHAGLIDCTLTPFIHNLWLQGVRTTVGNLLYDVDWEVIIPYLDRLVENGLIYPSRTMRLRTLARMMTGQGLPLPSRDDYVIGGNVTRCVLSSSMEGRSWLYSRLLDSVSRTTSIKLLGLEYILGKTWSYSLQHSNMQGWMGGVTLTGLGLSKFVGYMNAQALIYLHHNPACCVESSSHSQQLFCKDSYLALRGAITRRSTRVSVDTCDFPRTVQFVGKTLGLRALRVMVDVLQYHIEKNKTRVDKLNSRDEYTICPLVEGVERAQYFVQLSEKYLEEHRDQFEGVVSLDFERVAKSM